MGDIFISYRRSDSNHVTGRVYDRLARHFGENVVFKDVDNIPYGTDFRGAVLEAITRSQVVLAVIGNEWLAAVGANGGRRLDAPGDFVRLEIEAALERPIAVIPLLVGESPMPGPQELPPTLQKLSFKNGMTIRPDPDFHRDVDRLIQSLERLGLKANQNDARMTPGRNVQIPSHPSTEGAPTQTTSKISGTVDVFELAKQTRERVEAAHREARRLADVEQNFGESVEVLDKLPERLRDAAYYSSLVERRDRVTKLDHDVREAVMYRELTDLRPKVDELLRLVPHRDDLRRLFDVLERLDEARALVADRRDVRRAAALLEDFPEFLSDSDLIQSVRSLEARASLLEQGIRKGVAERRLLEIRRAVEELDRLIPCRADLGLILVAIEKHENAQRRIVEGTNASVRDAVCLLNDLPPDLRDSEFFSWLPTRLHEQGRALVRDGEYGEAISRFSSAISFSGGNATLFKDRGDAHLRQQRFDEAIADYTDAVRIEPSFTAAYLNRGSIYNNLRDYDRAIEDFGQAIRFEPKLARAYRYRASAYMNKGEHEGAVRDLDQAIRIDPSQADAYYRRGAAYGKIGDSDRSIAEYRQAHKLDPMIAHNLNERGLKHYQHGHYDLAIADFTEAIWVNPTDLRYFINRGNAYARKSEHDKALADHAEAIRISPRNAHAYNSRGTVHFNHDGYDEAIADYTKAIQFCATESAFRVNRGIAYTLKHKYDRAIADFDAAICIRPNNGQAYQCRGNVESVRGNVGQAIADYKQAISLLESKLGPDHRDTLCACDALGWIYNLAAQSVGAEQLLRDIVNRCGAQLGPEDPLTARLMANLGLSLWNQQKWSEAEPILRESLRICESKQADEWFTFNTWSMLGACLMGQGRYAEAEPLIVEGYDGLNRRAAALRGATAQVLRAAADRVINLYLAWDKPEKIREWEAKLGRQALPAH
jgi:tetratricopeptide (TPR) repeat protein